MHGGGHVWLGGMHGGGGMCGRGDVCGREHAWEGVHGGGGGGVCVAMECATGEMHGRTDGHCSGWYASYWNAVSLFSKLSTTG